MRGYSIAQRIYGTVDYRAARYVILPDFMVRQAFLTDSKAEKEKRSGTLQLSQTSMRIRQTRAGAAVDEAGLLPQFSTYGGVCYLTTTLLAHYYYNDAAGYNDLKEITVAAIPNGRLQAKDNPDASTSFWMAGRNAPARGEGFRVRISFSQLRQFAKWRAQTIQYDTENNHVLYQWEE